VGDLLLALAVLEQVSGGDDTVTLLCHNCDSFFNPRIDDELTWLALEVTEQGVDGHRCAWNDGGDVSVHQGGHLIAVPPAERTDLSLAHGGPPSTGADAPD